MTPFAINGLGRIGRALTRIAHRRDDLQLVAVNDRIEATTLARLLARDSVHGRFEAGIVGEPGRLEIAGREIRAFQESDPSRIPWHETPARLVVEATGAFTRRQAAAAHLGDTALEDPRKVLVSAIVEDADISLCPGVQSAYDPSRHHVISALSCTSHCLALLLDALEHGVGVRRALMNEVHSYTADQCLLDGDHRDPRRSRSAAVNIVPTRSAAPGAVAALKPSWQQKIGGMAVRVPTPNVALLEVVAILERPSTKEVLQQIFIDAAAGSDGELAVTNEPLVSTDIVGETASALVDLELISCSHDLCRIVAWYDNEWGYANRLADFVAALGAAADSSPDSDLHPRESSENQKAEEKSTVPQAAERPRAVVLGSCDQ